MTVTTIGSPLPGLELRIDVGDARLVAITDDAGTVRLPLALAPDHPLGPTPLSVRSIPDTSILAGSLETTLDIKARGTITYVAPPDAVAATAVLRPLRPPHRLLTILEGESLLNDASALLISSTVVSRFASNVA